MAYLIAIGTSVCGATAIVSTVPLINAKKIISQTGCDAVKLEGGNKIIKTVRYLIKNKVQVMGHIGLLPQSIKGNFIFKGKSKTERNKILREAKILESAGVFSIVLECVEKSLAKEKMGITIWGVELR